MKIKEISNNIELHKVEDGLALISNYKVIVQGFTDIGTPANGLVPIIYFKQQEFKYLDIDTLEIFDISNVNWISGFHYVGSNLTCLGHNYRSDPQKNLSTSYKYTSVEGMKIIFEKSVVAAHDLNANLILKKKDIVFKKPGSGIRAFNYKNLIGKKINKFVKKNSLLEKKNFYEN